MGVVCPSLDDLPAVRSGWVRFFAHFKRYIPYFAMAAQGWYHSVDAIDDGHDDGTAPRPRDVDIAPAPMPPRVPTPTPLPQPLDMGQHSGGHGHGHGTRGEHADTASAASHGASSASGVGSGGGGYGGDGASSGSGNGAGTSGWFIANPLAAGDRSLTVHHLVAPSGSEAGSGGSPGGGSDGGSYRSPSPPTRDDASPAGASSGGNGHGNGNNSGSSNGGGTNPDSGSGSGSGSGRKGDELLLLSTTKQRRRYGANGSGGQNKAAGARGGGWSSADYTRLLTSRIKAVRQGTHPPANHGGTSHSGGDERQARSANGHGRDSASSKAHRDGGGDGATRGHRHSGQPNKPKHGGVHVPRKVLHQAVRQAVKSAGGVPPAKSHRLATKTAPRERSPPTRQPPGKARSTTASAARPVTEGTASSAGIGNGGRRSALSPTSPRAQASVLAETERVVEEAEQALRMYREMNLRAR